MSTSIKIGFADAVREAVAHDSENWLYHGWKVIRRTEPFKGRGDRVDAMYFARDHLTQDYKEYLRLMNERIDIDRKLAETARQMRMALRGGAAL